MRRHNKLFGLVKRCHRGGTPQSLGRRENAPGRAGGRLSACSRFLLHAPPATSSLWRILPSAGQFWCATPLESFYRGLLGRASSSIAAQGMHIASEDSLAACRVTPLLSDPAALLCHLLPPLPSCSDQRLLDLSLSGPWRRATKEVNVNTRLDPVGIAVGLQQHAWQLLVTGDVPLLQLETWRHVACCPVSTARTPGSLAMKVKGLFLIELILQKIRLSQTRFCSPVAVDVQLILPAIHAACLSWRPAFVPHRNLTKH